MRFTKMHGIGNDFVMLDALKQPIEEGRLAGLSRAMCDRRFGIGADGVILACAGTKTPLRMRMFNPDGSEGEMCGNGLRCLAKFLVAQGQTPGPSIPVETGAGVLALAITQEQQVRVDMGLARLTRADVGMSGDPNGTFVDQPIAAEGQTLNATAVSMGNPHLVCFVPDVQAVPLRTLGPSLEHHPAFLKRINVHFVQVLSRAHLRQRTWERGAGETLACGTGACSATVAGALTGRSDRAVTVSLPGGDLHIEYADGGTVTMTGPADSVFTGDWPD